LKFSAHTFSIIPFYLMFLNRRHAKRRQELGKSAAMVDESMMGKDRLQDGKTDELEEAASRRHKALEEDNALRDMTDLQNEDFIYVY